MSAYVVRAVPELRGAEELLPPELMIWSLQNVISTMALFTAKTVSKKRLRR